MQAPNTQTVGGRCDRAILALLLGCGLRRAEVAKLQVRDVQQREEHWAVVDLIGKGRHIRTVPVSDWVKVAMDDWTGAATITDGRLFRCVSRTGAVWGSGITEKVVWHTVKRYAAKVGIQRLAPMIVAVHAPVCAMLRAANWSRSNSCWGTFQWKPRSDTSDANSGCVMR